MINNKIGHHISDQRQNVNLFMYELFNTIKFLLSKVTSQDLLGEYPLEGVTFDHDTGIARVQHTYSFSLIIIPLDLRFD